MDDKTFTKLILSLMIPLVVTFIIIYLKILPDATVAANSPITTTPGTTLDTLVHKGVHFGMFAGLSWTLCLAAWITWREQFGWPLALAWSAVISGLSEYFQTYAAGRYGSVSDFFIDLGSSIGGIIIWVLPFAALWSFGLVRGRKQDQLELDTGG